MDKAVPSKPLFDRIDYHTAGKRDVLRMCMRQNRDPISDSGDGNIAHPIPQMREPPGALGDIVRRMKRRAALEQSAGAGPKIRSTAN